MIIAVISDIHGNVHSLEKALKLIEVYKPDKFLFLGDMAGYYYYQNESIDLLNNLDNLITIKGNHDHYFIKSRNNDKYLHKLVEKYGKSYYLLNKNVTKTSMEFFQNMKKYEKNDQFEAYHGTPLNNLEGYCYPDTTIDFKVTSPIVFLGHTHYPMTRKYNDTIIINPGSIGQPRDFNKGSFCIVDIDNIKIEHVRYEYKKGNLEQMISYLKDNKYLLEVLERKENE